MECEIHWVTQLLTLKVQKTITDGKTVEMAAGKNLTVKQTSNKTALKLNTV